METHGSHGPDVQKELKTHISGAAETLKDIKAGGKFDLGKEFMNAFEVLKLNTKKMEEIAVNKAAALPALLFIIAGVVAFHLGFYFFMSSISRGLFGVALTPGILDLIISIVLSSAVAIVQIFVLDFVGNVFFKGQGKFGELFRVLGYASVVMLLCLIFQLGVIGGLWFLIAAYFALNKIKKLNPTNTVITLVIALVVTALVTYLLNLLFAFIHFGGIFSIYTKEYFDLINTKFY